MSTDPSFRMTVEDVFTIRDRGTVVTGRVESGTLAVGDEVFIQRGGNYKKVQVKAVEMFHKTLERANAGDIVGVLLGDLTRDDVQHGDVLAGSGSDFTWKP